MYPSTGQPQTAVPARPMAAPSRWSSGLFGCGEDCSSCCLTCFCPCISFGRIAEIAGKGSTSCGAHCCCYLVLSYCMLQCLYTCTYRSKLREQYMLPAQPCNDCLVHCCCGPCALCQEYRELKCRGFEPSLGWEGNLARQNQGIMMPPAGHNEMKRQFY